MFRLQKKLLETVCHTHNHNIETQNINLSESNCI